MGSVARHLYLHVPFCSGKCLYCVLYSRVYDASQAARYVDAILRDRKPLVDVALALNMTVAGIVAHQSALKGGELLKIPQYAL